ncbi:MAG: putative tRNA threonylcarbamoyladenosine biosynthesis protein Gcp [Parcubacteria group bacterium GW2011_GWF2_38_8]|nr:MAG: putative tRNA threonylcarbamoyladenosine biosynthesis protein Gcp [Parcubacteria group bacterium GW2011_GWF2_38_8]
MKILSIETSCDDTAIAIMEAKGGIKNASFQILANASNSQTKIHAPYGGVYPNLAKKEHIKNLPVLLKKVLKIVRQDLATKKPVDVIAVTYGPGLEPALWAGIVFAKELAKKWNIPLLPVNHMEGHIFSVFGKSRGKFKIKISKYDFSTLALLVSGGHTELVLIKEFMKYKVIGKTLDDAAGEAFDKVARMMDLSYPGGPEISKLAEKERAKEKQSLRGVSQADKQRGSAPRARRGSNSKKISFPFVLPRPMIHSKNFDFSFSGLKTAVLYLIKKIGPLNDKIKQEIALEFENAVVETLVYKTKKAKEKYKVKTVIVAGGVAGNKYLRKEMKKIIGKETNLLFPKKGLATDNSIMIGIAGYLQFIKKDKKIPKIENVKAKGNLRLK